MADTITTLTLDEVVSAVREAGALKVCILAEQSSGHDWPTICVDQGMPTLANVRRITAQRVALGVHFRELQGNVLLITAIHRIGIPAVGRVLQSASAGGWMRACDEQRAIHKAFGDEEHMQCWERLAKAHPALEVLALIGNGELPKPIPPKPDVPVPPFTAEEIAAHEPPLDQ
jgi:hypothetical protein